MAVLNQTLVEPQVVLPTFNFSPAAGPLGTEVVISGSALSKPVSLVLFNGVAASRFPDPSNPANLIAIVPAGATDGPIRLRFSDGSSIDSLGNFDVTPGIADPKIRDFFPASGGVGSLVQLNGSGFTNANSVTFGGVPATQVNFQADTNIIAVVPNGAVDGPIKVIRGSQVGTSSTNFDVTGGFSITNFTPLTGLSGGNCTIFGNGFIGVTQVTFGSNLSMPFSIVNDGQINATIPPGLAGQMVFITVSKPGLSATSTIPFTYENSPSGFSFNPTSGPVGTQVTITGSNLAGVDVVRFAGTVASFVVNSASTLTATVPAGAQDGLITLEDNGLVTQSTQIFDVTQPSYAISSLSPSSGAVGASIAINGTGLTGTDTVLFGNSLASFSVVSDNKIQAVVPSGMAGTNVIVTVRKAGQVANGSLVFSYVDSILRPSISNFSPASGAVGASIMIAGNNLAGVDVVRFAGVAANFVINSNTSITATVPQGAVDGLITVEDNGFVAASATAFDVIMTGTYSLSGLSPATGQIGSTVLLQGTGLLGTDSILFGSVPTSFTVLDSTRIQAVVPKGSGSVRVTARRAGVVATGAPVFTYGNVVGIAINGLSPNPAAIGTSVSIIGIGLSSVSSVRVGRLSVPFTILSDTEVRITANFSGIVSVLSPSGSASSAEALSVF